MIHFILTISMALALSPCAHAFENLPSPPLDAKAGVSCDGVQIGLWTEKEEYSSGEVRNVWIFARKSEVSKTTIGVGGSLYRKSFVYITDAKGERKKVPVSGGIDGWTDPLNYMGGISDHLARLSSGSYDLVWRTKDFESNSIKIKIK